MRSCVYIIQVDDDDDVGNDKVNIIDCQQDRKTNKIK